ncbi:MULTISPECIES: short-chain dehydrogenase [unclassified Pseudomonas]|uniref:short-chain dehydrogenase n=1 Tax=unclassified Pseudomonas TaxID=196821 RepID=UPI0030D9AA4B
MNQHMGLTSNADDQPLYVDTTAPLHILLDSAAYRIRAATQFLENLAMRDEQTIDPATLQDLAQLCCIPLRDGCDVMDVIARRLDAAPAGSTL